MQKYKNRLVGVHDFFLKNSGDKRCYDEAVLEVLRFDREDFEEIPGTYFTIVVRLIANT